ncbi:MAG: pteridine reductase [Proteobacteria bacterium]|nr:pteridine reductase [Pseudomonadota bacterium]
MALITGAARRIGAVIAETLHLAGYNVIIHCHQSVEAADRLIHSLNQNRPDSAARVTGDLNQFSHYQSIITEAHQKWGRLDILINNASSFYPTPMGKTTEQQWQDLLNTNLKAPFFLSQAAAPFLQKNQGSIINIADIHGIKPLKNYPVYSIAKAGIIMLTKTLARELAPAIRVNAIAPGVTLPSEALQQDSNMLHTLKARTLLDRFPKPEDIAQAMLFLISQQAITGQTINIDSGRSIR